MSAITSHLARRAVQAYGAAREVEPSAEVVEALQALKEFRIPDWAYAVFAVTFIMYLIVSLSIRYSLGEVMSALVMVETPAAMMDHAASKDSLNDEPDAPLLSKEEKEGIPTGVHVPELSVTKKSPITSSIRATARHLRARGGRLARYRGLAVFVVYNLIAFHGSAFLECVVRSRIVASFLASILTTPLLLTWTHIVISEPSSKAWFRRLPSRKAIVKVLPATVMWAVAEHVALVLPTVLFMQLGLHRSQNFNVQTMSGEDGEKVARVVALKFLAVMATAFFSFVLIVIPANVTLTRVQASLLADSEETIVPVDRSFQGKVVPEILGGSGKLSILDAWKTFDWSARFRLLKLWVKIAAIQTTIALLFLAVIMAEATFIFRDVLPKAKKVFCANMHRGVPSHGGH